MKETERIEFKKSTSELKPGVISIASMLNKNGYGELYFGIRNDGSVCGQQIGEKTTRVVSVAIKDNIKPNIVPSIETITMDDKEVIKVVCRGEDTPYSAYNRYYIRSDDEDLIMSTADLESFLLNKNYDYSKWEKKSSGCGIDSVDEDLLIEYVNGGNESGRIGFIYRDAKTTLEKLNLVVADELNNAGYYLFSNQKPLTLKLAIYPTDERLSFVDMKTYQGNIFECINEALKYIQNNIHWKAEIVGAKRVEIPEIPVEAIREIVVNSFAHMRVNDSSSNEIYITPTRVHIYNPGPMVPGTTPEMFASGEQGSMIRNPIIASVLYYNHTIDAFGTGFERVFRLCRDIDYRYSNNSFGFTFEFLRKPYDAINDAISETITTEHERKLSSIEKKLYQMISTGERHTKKEYAEMIEMSVATVDRAIKKLTEAGLIRRVGANRNGSWEITDPQQRTV